LQLQELDRSEDRVLAVAELAGRRNEGGWFSTRDVEAMYETLRLPAPSVAGTLSNLSKKELIVRRTKPPPWSLTPTGRRTVLEMLGDVESVELEAQLAQLPGAELADAHLTVLPPGLAPPKWMKGITELLDRSPFETNVLCMTRFPRADKPDDPIASVIETAKSVLAEYGLRLHLASDGSVEDTLFGNVAAYMWACQHGFALIEDRVDEGVNYNVVIEVGAMIMAGRHTALLKDDTVPTLPTDLVGHIYKPVDFADLESVARAAHAFAADDLGLTRKS
jgi:hypothetical protein